MLQPFREVTDELQRDSETVGSIIPAFLDLRYKIEELSRPSGCIPHHREIAVILLKSLETRLEYVLDDGFFLLGDILNNF